MKAQNFFLFSFIILLTFTQLACVKDDISNSFSNPQTSLALDGVSTKSSTQSIESTDREGHSCNCALQIVDAYSPTPPGGSGGY